MSFPGAFQIENALAAFQIEYALPQSCQFALPLVRVSLSALFSTLLFLWYAFNTFIPLSVAAPRLLSGCPALHHDPMEHLVPPLEERYPDLVLDPRRIFRARLSPFYPGYPWYDVQFPGFHSEFHSPGKEYILAWQATLPSPFPRPLCRDDLWTPWAYTFRRSSLYHVLQMVWGAIPDTKAKEIDVKSFNTFLRMSITILAGIHPALVEHMLCGPVMKAKLINYDVAKHLTRKHDLKGRPCIYLLELIDEHGNAPSVALMDRVMKLVRDRSNPYYQKFMQGSGKDRIEELCRAWDRLYDTIPASDRDKPCPVPFRDVGYTDNPELRIRSNHKKLTNSNLVMEYIVTLLRTIDKRYFIDGNVIFRCSIAAHSAFAEFLFTYLLGANTSTGRGFNSWEPGISNASAKNVTSEQ